MSSQEDHIRAAVQEMIDLGYIEESRGPHGELIWALTESGRDYMARLQEHAE